MKYSHKIEQAIRKATLLHRGQLRKGDGSTPFIEHPFAVALILSKYTDDEDIIITGILHDTAEETDYSFEDIENDFGNKVSKMVASMTEVRKRDEEKVPWRERKERYLDLMKKMNEDELIVSAADKLHNLSSHLYDYEIMGEDMWSKFNAPADKRLWFYKKAIEIFKDRLDHPLVLELEKQFENAKQVFEVDP
ncbi:hypothetical protein C0581_04345 [Candidatus Parcubacteria bacterium]|nr:MAG: hypothetical protein C0581_04345 [Candidatus Parcubacteria bacterium]